ncbi:MAG: carboxypeptidase-like regulatory domain-containing protein [Candidatus Binataceae bacterium]
MPIGTGHAQVPPNADQGTLVVALTGTLPAPNVGFVPGFQSLSFNVLAVKLNPSTDPFVPQTDPNWTTIPVAQGVGFNDVGTVDVFTQLATLFNLNTVGPNPAAAGTGPSEFQIDINQIQTVPQLFNAALVPANTYHQIELVLDGSNAGTVVPTCLETPQALLEGCIASQISLAGNVNPLQTSSLAGVSVPLNGLTTLVISINPINVGGIPVPPPFSGGLYEFAPNITLPPDPVNFLGLVTGGAFGASKVAAELADTGQVVETTTIGGGLYQLPLPASANGTLYDLVASGPGFTYAFAHNVLVQRGRVESVQLDAAPTGKIALSGKVTDACSGAALPGATLEIVAPAAGSGADCTQIPLPTACVVLASANTDDTGTYPMPPSNFSLQSFNAVPNGNYTMVVIDAGYDTVASSLSVSGGAACSAGTGGVCNFALGRSTINGLVTISPPVPSPRALNVLVTAEDNGTHHIENVALTTVPIGSTAAPFTMFVPDQGSVASLDLYATVSDYFNGLPEKSSGHTIGVLSGLATASRCGIAATNPILSMQCAGHGSIMGSTTPFDDGTTVVLSKNGVQLMSTGVGPNGSPVGGGRFSLCAPADPAPYELQRFEANPPAAQPLPVGTPVPQLMMPPLQVAQPCSSICGTGSGQCLVCVNNPGVKVP